MSTTMLYNRRLPHAPAHELGWQGVRQLCKLVHVVSVLTEVPLFARWQPPEREQRGAGRHPPHPGPAQQRPVRRGGEAAATPGAGRQPHALAGLARRPHSQGEPAAWLGAP